MGFIKKLYSLCVLSICNSLKNNPTCSESFLIFQHAKRFELLALQHMYNSHSADKDQYIYAYQRNAFWYFLHAALKGYSESQYKLGICYLKGELGLTQDKYIAQKWFTLAANQGHLDALYELNLIRTSQQYPH
ncbi:Sel1 repeat protein [Acinetobacter stercoris]|uniref:Sel1 repeat protein n=1 Tax=Acinetobacter stercoris TaxID=2126983 RepID=A0A2U3N3K3_9GAMM|nr:Sel1 repeat protein [Acinetobacter stercoris]